MADDPLLELFKPDGLREDLRPVSNAFERLAKEIVDRLPANDHRGLALARLLEAKDHALHSILLETATKED